MKKSYLLIAVLATVLGFSAALWLLKPQPVPLQAITWFGEQAKPLPAFELTDQNGNAFNPDTLKGRWQLLFFGYTNCPDICPDTLQMLANMVAQIKDPEVLEQLQITFITVDPQRDQLDKMKSYVTYFNADFNSARGPMDELNKLTNQLGILHHIDRSEDGSKYEVAHSGALALIDPRARYIGVFSTPLDSGKIAHDLSTIINS